MESTDIGLSLGGAVVAGTALAGAFLGSIQLIGIGATLSILITVSSTVYRFRYERREDKRKQTNEMILRLKPTIYAPLMKWTHNTMKHMSNMAATEDPFIGFIQSSAAIPPDLSDEPDYVGIVGDTLKSVTVESLQLYNAYIGLKNKVRSEYRNRLELLIRSLNPAWGLDNVNIEFKDTNGQTLFQYNIATLASMYSIESAQEWVRKAHHILLTHTTNPVGQVPCPNLVLTAFKDPSGLTSFGGLQTSRESLWAHAMHLMEQLGQAALKGENDWKMKPP